MVMRKTSLLLRTTALCCSLLASVSEPMAKEIDTNIAKMQAMDKITGKVSVIEVPVNGDVKFGSLSIVVRACKTRPPEESPEDFAFVDIVDIYNSEKPVNIFRGWMMSSTPALNPVEHPIYDVWLLKCVNGRVDEKKLLSAENLKERDGIERVLSVEKQKELSSKKEFNTDIRQNDVVAEAAITDATTIQEKNVEIKNDKEDALSPIAEDSSDNIISVTDGGDGSPKSLLSINEFKPQVDEASNSVDSVIEDTSVPTVVEEIVIKETNVNDKDDSGEQLIDFDEIEEEAFDIKSDSLKN